MLVQFPFWNSCSRRRNVLHNVWDSAYISYNRNEQITKINKVQSRRTQDIDHLVWCNVTYSREHPPNKENSLSIVLVLNPIW